MIVNYAATDDTWLWMCAVDDGRCPGAFQVGCDPDDSFTTTTTTTTTTDPDAPEWVQLPCGTSGQEQQYLFSDDKHTWDEARAECDLYGGWLVSVGSQAEYNCLLRYGNAQGYHSWFWTDGIYIS